MENPHAIFHIMENPHEKNNQKQQPNMNVTEKTNQDDDDMMITPSPRAYKRRPKKTDGMTQTHVLQHSGLTISPSEAPNSDCPAPLASVRGRGKGVKRSKSRGRNGRRNDENSVNVMKLDVLNENLRVIPFKARNIGDISKFKKELKSLGLWDFANIVFDEDIRADVIAKVVAFYRSGDNSSSFDGVMIKVSRMLVARALKLPCRKKKVGEATRFSTEFVVFLEKFVENYMVLQGDDWFKPDEVEELMRKIAEGRPQEVDWAWLIWFMIVKELDKGECLKECYYASHLQQLVKVQKPELLNRDKGEVSEGVEVLGAREWRQKVEEHNVVHGLGGGSVGEGGEDVKVLGLGEWRQKEEERNAEVGEVQGDVKMSEFEVSSTLAGQMAVEECHVELSHGRDCLGEVENIGIVDRDEKAGDDGQVEMSSECSDPADEQDKFDHGREGSGEVENVGIVDKDEKSGDDGQVQMTSGAEKQEKFDLVHEEKDIQNVGKDEILVCNVDPREEKANEGEMQVVVVQEDVVETERIEGVFSRGMDSEVCRVEDVIGFEVVEDVDMDCGEDIVVNAANVDCRAMEIDNNIPMVKDDSKDVEIVNDVEQVGQWAFGWKQKNQHVLRPCGMANTNVSVENSRLDVAQSIEDLNDKSPNEQPLDGTSSVNHMQAFPTGQLAYTTLEFGDPTLIDPLPMAGSVMKDGNSISDHRTWKGDNYPEQGFSEPVLNGHQNGSTSNGFRGHNQSDFDVKVDKIVDMLGELKLLNGDAVQQVNTMTQQMLSQQLADKAAESEQLRIQLKAVQRQHQAETIRLNKELHLMKDVSDGYRKALKATQTKFSDYRKSMGVREKPIYRDAGSGGVVKTVVELERESRVKQEHEKVLFFYRLRKVCDDCIVECDSKQKELLAKVQSMDDRLQNAAQEVGVLKYQLVQQKTTSSSFQIQQISSEEELSD